MTQLTWSGSMVLVWSVLAGCGSSAPIVIHPTLPRPAQKLCPEARATIAIAAIADERGYADPHNVGFTQTGLSNVKASLELEPTAAELVQSALAQALARCGLARAQSGKPSWKLRVELLRLQVSEETEFTSETMRGDVRYEVEAVDEASGKSLGRFSALGHAEDSGMDTTDYAEGVISHALEASLPQFLAGLAHLREVVTAPPPPPPSPAVPEGADDTQASADSPAETTPAAVAPPAVVPPSVASAQPALPLRITTRRLNDSEQRTRFGTTFADKRVLAMELVLRRVQEATPHALGFRRQHFRLTFGDGTQRLPLDPLKVQERNRGQMTTVIYAGGVFVPYSMDASHETSGLDKSVDQLVLPPRTGELRGLLFFDLEGVQRPAPRKLEVGYEDLVTHENKQLVVTY